ncbi:M48 family metallopeptidase [Thermoproteota archaeon]
MVTKENLTKIADMDVQTVRKDIKNMHLGVYPPNGRVRVAAPLETTDEKIKLLVLSKMAWIKRNQAKFRNQERETRREYVSGESHFFMGKRYLLNVIHTNLKQKIVTTRNSHIDMIIRPKTSQKKREELLNTFYRSELKKQIPPLLEKWEKITGVKVNEFRIKRMKTKWGSCTPEHKRIWFNLELAKKTLHCLEYVLVHELTHIVEKNHTEKFKLLMYSFMPKWAQYKEELNSGKIGHFTWDYKVE